MDPQGLTMQDPLPSEVHSVETIERPPSRISNRAKPMVFHPLSIHVVALLVPASIFGTLARLGLTALARYQGNSIFPLAYAQGLGCLIMGFAVGLKDPFSTFYPPLFTAVTTGFCGSLTTFSGWQVDIFDSWINAGQYYHGGLRNFLDGLGKSVFTLSISLASVSFGMQLAAAVRPYLPAIPPPPRLLRYAITIISILFYGAVFPIFFVMDSSYRHQATAALLFASPGTITRYLLSVHLNTMLNSMPLGTFSANMIGTALLGGFNVLQKKVVPVSSYACGVLQGLNDGYCGCLTTVSTFAVEIRGLGFWKGSRYAVISWGVAQLLLLLILGPSLWTGHSRGQITCTFV
ncbi:UPF0695 membrane protein [Termitomyces sp. T112]|nr:UPF0695 membrane protein [Termitomyces sp. T112]